MKKWVHQIEVAIDELIPPALLLLLGIIIAEFFYHDQIEPYLWLIDSIDFAIILLFLLDLGFKYLRARNIPQFLRSSWLEIIAILPAFFVVRIFEFIIPLSKIDLIADSAHGLIETGAKWGLIVREVEATGEVSRLAIANRFIRPLARLPRFAKAFSFYEKPTGNAHPYQ